MLEKQSANSLVAHWLLRWILYVHCYPLLYCHYMFSVSANSDVTHQKGPEIRTGNTVGDQDIPISIGTELNITTNEKYATACDDKNM